MLYEDDLDLLDLYKEQKKGGREDAHLKRHRGSKVNEQMEATLTPACGNNFINLFFFSFCDTSHMF